MAGNLKDVRVVTFKEDFGRFKKGEHAMHVSLAEKLEKKGAKISIKSGKEEYEKRVEVIKTEKAKQENKD
jgi:hypothetical protein